MNRKGLAPLEIAYSKRRFLTGFTLFELIIVMIVLFILTSYAMLRLTSIGDKSTGVSEQALMAAFKGAVSLYYAKNHTWPDWVDDNNPQTPGPFSLLAYPPPYKETGHGDGRHWSYQRSVRGYWWIRCPHNKIWWFYFVEPGTLQMDCPQSSGDYNAGTTIRCKKTPLTHDYEPEF